jgi:hypothetical protein
VRGVRPLHVRKQEMHVGGDRLRLRGDDMSRSLRPQRQGALVGRERRIVESCGRGATVLRTHRAIDDPAGNCKADYRTETGGALDDEFAHDAGSTLAHALQTEVPLLATMHDIRIDT